MKKILTIIILLISFTTYAQQEFQDIQVIGFAIFQGDSTRVDSNFYIKNTLENTVTTKVAVIGTDGMVGYVEKDDLLFQRNGVHTSVAGVPQKILFLDPMPSTDYEIWIEGNTGDVAPSTPYDVTALGFWFVTLGDGEVKYIAILN